MSGVSFTIYGQAYSKANSRKIVTIGGRPASIKSKEALAFERDALRQIPPSARLRIDVPVCVMLQMYYANERPDLDETLVLDILQDRWVRDATGKRRLVQAGVYRNDRLVREKHVYHRIDARRPRVEVTVAPMVALSATASLFNDHHPESAF